MGDGQSAAVLFIHLPAPPPPYPSVSSRTSRHLSPPDGVPLQLHSEFFLSLDNILLASCHYMLFLSCLCTHPCTFVPFSAFLVDKLTVAPPLSLASGSSPTSNMLEILCTVLHTFTWCQGNSSNLHTKHCSLYCMLLSSCCLVLCLDYLSLLLV